jgi:hypothetical protein
MRSQWETGQGLSVKGTDGIEAKWMSMQILVTNEFGYS